MRRHQLAARRKEQGYTQEGLAAKIPVSWTTVARWERGDIAPNADKRRPLAQALNVSLARLDRILVNEDHETSDDNDLRLVVPGWFGHYVTLEQSTSSILTWQPLLVPGLLQTRAYAMAVLNDADLVEARLRRQNPLHREHDPITLTAVIDESVLYRPIGGWATLRGQVDALAEMTERDSIDLRILPLNAEDQPIPYGAVVILESGWGSIVYLEHETGGVYLDEPHQIKKHKSAFERLAGLASRDETIRMLRQRCTELRV